MILNGTGGENHDDSRYKIMNIVDLYKIPISLHIHLKVNKFKFPLPILTLGGSGDLILHTLGRNAYV